MSSARYESSKPWGAPVNEVCERAEPPVDAKCIGCHEPIQAEGPGVVLPTGEPSTEEPMHLDCFLAAIGMRKVAR